MFVGNIRRVFERALMAIRDPLSATPIFLGVSFVLTKRHFFSKNNRGSERRKNRN